MRVKSYACKTVHTGNLVVFRVNQSCSRMRFIASKFCCWHFKRDQICMTAKGRQVLAASTTSLWTKLCQHSDSSFLERGRGYGTSGPNVSGPQLQSQSRHVCWLETAWKAGFRDRTTSFSLGSRGVCVHGMVYVIWYKVHQIQCSILLARGLNEQFQIIVNVGTKAAHFLFEKACCQ